MIQKMEHVAIIVRNMDETIQFYSETFGFKVRLRGRKSDREMAFLYLDTQRSMEIELIQQLTEGSEYSETGIVNHLAFTVENIEETIQFLREKDITFTSEDVKPTLEGGRMILFHGPNRELLQLVERVKEPSKSKED
ncbi:VOC family protein [Niallia sp. Krafla_26]|uniref:VOC family protein n=1 Tax=Niallia sp. Krafla_26 TaxID=3064703 RepID=UPI003D186716